MTSIRDFIALRRAELLEELAAATESIYAELFELDAAEAALGGVHVQHKSELPKQLAPENKMTIKDMVMSVLDVVNGADANEILKFIKHRFDVELARTSLSPQLSRLKKEGKIVLRGKRWSVVRNDEGPAKAGPSRSVGVAGLPGEHSSQVLPVGSTPTTSTAQSGAGNAPSDLTGESANSRHLFNTQPLTRES